MRFEAILMSCDNRIKHLCACIIEFINFFAKKPLTFSASLAFNRFSSTHLINSMKHEYSCKILYICNKRCTHIGTSIYQSPLISTELFQHNLINVLSHGMLSLSDHGDVALFK